MLIEFTGDKFCSDSLVGFWRMDDERSCLILFTNTWSIYCVGLTVARSYTTVLVLVFTVFISCVSEPYLTFKTKCFYCDENDYGESWKRITENVHCQDSLFENCFKNRTIAGRHETHVLALFRYCDIEQCACTDIAGWSHSNQCGSHMIRCCLDIGRESVIC